MVWVKMHPLFEKNTSPMSLCHAMGSYDVLGTTATKRYQILHGDRCWCTDQKTSSGAWQVVIMNTYTHKNINMHTKIANCLTPIRVTAPQQPVASQHDTNQEQLGRSERTDIMRPRTGGGEEGMVDSPKSTMGWRWWLVCWWWMGLFSVLDWDYTK